jgi:hypothetical protein
MLILPERVLTPGVSSRIIDVVDGTVRTRLPTQEQTEPFGLIEKPGIRRWQGIDGQSDGGGETDAIADSGRGTRNTYLSISGIDWCGCQQRQDRLSGRNGILFFPAKTSG